MQDAGRFPPQKPNPNSEGAQDTPRATQDRDAAGKPAFKVTFERPETRDALKSSEKYAAHVALVPEPAPANSYSTETTAAGGPASNTGGAITRLERPDTSDAAEMSEPQARANPSVMQLLTAPLLAIIAALSLLTAGWSYARFTETRAELASTTEALTAAITEKAAAAKAKLTAEKALAAASAENASAAQARVSAEKALADAQTRLASVEKTVADIKAALATIVTGAVPAAAASDTEPAAGTSPAQ